MSSTTPKPVVSAVDVSELSKTSQNAIPARSYQASSLKVPDGLAKSVIRVPDIVDNLELQIAMDEFASGSTEALKKVLAKAGGVDPETVSLRATPWTLKVDDSSEIKYVGKIDSIDDTYPKDTDRLGAIEKVREDVWIDLAAEPSRRQLLYRPLNPAQEEIRLLKLGETQWSGVYDRLIMQTFAFTNAPKYACISYVWGDANRSVPINCDGKIAMVTSNLYHALSTSFSRYPDMYLWADGLCINQEDIEERAQQVRLMGQIYSSCERVLAFPGHFRYAQREGHDQRWQKAQTHLTPGSPSHKTREAANDDSSVTKPREHSVEFTTVRSAISLMNFLGRIWDTQKNYEIITDAEWEKYNIPDFDSEDGKKIWENVFSFWEEDWLWRTWVLPECVLSPKVIVFYADYVVSLDAMMDFWNSALNHGLPKALRYGHIGDMFKRILHTTPVTTFSTLRKRCGSEESVETNNTIEERTNSEKPMDLLDVLALCRHNHVTDDRDKVYAMIGLSSDEIANSIPQSYHPSNSVINTYLTVAQRYVEAGRSLDLLELAGKHTKLPGLPTWVPDWTHQSRSRLKTNLYNCTKNTSACVFPSQRDPTKLKVRPAVLAHISAVGPAWRYYTSGIDKIDVNARPFEPMTAANGDKIDIPPFTDEDARCVIVEMALKLKVLDPDAEKGLSTGMEEAIARTLCADISWSGERLAYSPTALNIFMKSFQAFRSFYRRGPDPENTHLRLGSTTRVHKSGIFHWLLDCSKEEADGLMSDLWPFAMALQEAQRGRRFAVLEGGTIATVPWDAEIGDLVVLLEGARVPFVMRASDTADSHDGLATFQLVGDCYVEGIMDGELVCNVDDTYPGIDQVPVVLAVAEQQLASKRPGQVQMWLTEVLLI